MSIKGRSTSNSLDSGVIYCATGKELFLDELVISLEFLKKYNRNCNVSIFTEEKFLAKINNELFDSIHLIENPQYSFADKIYSLKNSPYKKTLYLDCDIVVTDEISEIFNILDEFDLTLAYIPYKNRKFKKLNSPLFNGGLVAFKKNKRTSQFLEFWDKKYKVMKISDDQPALREAIYTTKVSTFKLPSEYNFRLPFSSYVKNKIKVFHGHDLLKLERNKINSIIKYLNNREEERVWFPQRGILYLKEERYFISRILIFIETKLMKKFKKRFWDSPFIKSIKNKLWQYYFPFFINWVITTQLK